ncbi:hypothetical protein FOA52_000629 [Chlamydomonas sp. UWO 241]|nr:hypothetical protein FOA52_000629 [Chlamydomonas sp. UWO 241]
MDTAWWWLVLVALLAAWMALLAARSRLRPPHDLDAMSGPWREAWPILGNIMSLFRHDFHRVLLEWTDQYGGVFRGRLLWMDGIVVTDLPDRLMASPVPPDGPPPVRAPDDNPASPMLVDDHVELVPPPAEEPKKRNAFDLMKASNLKAASRPRAPASRGRPSGNPTATPAADGPTIDATPIATSVKKKPPSSEAQKSWIKTFPFIFIATAVNLATNGAVLVGCSVCREIYGANSNKSYAAGNASVYSLNDLTKHSKCDEHKDAVDAKVKKDGGSGGIVAAAHAGARAHVEVLKGLLPTLLMGALWICTELLPGLKFASLLVVLTKAGNTSAPPPAKVKFFKGNFKMTTAYKFAADFADAAIESLKESFFDDVPSLDILACFTIFDPVQNIGMGHAELDDFGNDSFQQLKDHFWSGDGLPNSPFSARGESFMATLDTEFKHVKTVIKDRLALTPSATMLNLWRFIARSSDSLMVPNIILLMNVYHVMALHTAESFTGPRESENNSLINEAAEKLSGASLQSQGVNPPSLLKRLVEEVSRVQVSFLDRDLDEAASLLEKEGLEDVDPAVAFDVEGNIAEEEDAASGDPTALATIVGRGPGALGKAAKYYIPINGMTSPHEQHANLLTSEADPQWHAVRKAVARAFAWQNVKHKFPIILHCVDEMINVLRAKGPAASVDADQMALRVTLDVIGAAGFGHEYRSVLQEDPAPSGHLLRVLPRCFHECMLRIASPLRSRAPWLFDLTKSGYFGKGRAGVAAFADFQAEMSRLLDKMLERDDDGNDNQDIGTQLARLIRQGDITKGRALSELGILFVEGFETTGHTISWTLMHVAVNEGVQDRIAEELDSLGLLDKPRSTPLRSHEVHGPVNINAGAGAGAPCMQMHSSGTGKGAGAGEPAGAPSSLASVSEGEEEEQGSGGGNQGGSAWQHVAGAGQTEEAGPGGDLRGPLGSRRTNTTAATTAAAATAAAAGTGGSIGSDDGSCDGADTAPATAATATATATGTVGSGGSGGSCSGSSSSGGADTAYTTCGGTSGCSGGAARQLSIDDLRHLPYLTACLKESMRMHPVVSIMARVTDAPTVIGGYRIPANTPVVTPLFGIQNAAASWEKPMVFAPERWARVPTATYVAGPSAFSPVGSSFVRGSGGSFGGGGGGSGRSGRSDEDASGSGSGSHVPPSVADQISFMPFSEGPRNCVGQSLAKLEVLAVLAKLLGSFRVELAEETGGAAGVRARESTALTLQIRPPGIRVHCVPRC